MKVQTTREVKDPVLKISIWPDDNNQMIITLEELCPRCAGRGCHRDSVDDTCYGGRIHHTCGTLGMLHELIGDSNANDLLSYLRDRIEVIVGPKTAPIPRGGPDDR